MGRQNSMGEERDCGPFLISLALSALRCACTGLKPFSFTILTGFFSAYFARDGER